MGMTVDTDTQGQAAAKRHFGSYLGLFYVAAILGVLGFAVLHDTGTSHAYERLRPGMTPTEVAALLGVPRSDQIGGSRRAGLANSRRFHHRGRVLRRQARLEGTPGRRGRSRETLGRFTFGLAQSLGGSRDFSSPRPARPSLGFRLVWEGLPRYKPDGRERRRIRPRPSTGAS